MSWNIRLKPDLAIGFLALLLMLSFGYPILVFYIWVFVSPKQCPHVWLTLKSMLGFDFWIMITIQKLKRVQALSLDCTWVNGELSCLCVVRGLVII